jgi:hypothetical protein
MSKRLIHGESSPAANKRHAVPQQDEEDPLPSASSSLVIHQASSSSIPTTPTHLIADLILPFVADRETWNSVCSVSKDLRLVATNMTPPWPNKSFNLGHSAWHVAFSPSGSQLAFCINTATQKITSSMLGIDGARKPSSRVTPNTCIAWNVHWMGSIWRQEAAMDRFESGTQNRFTPLLQRHTWNDPHGHQNKPTQLLQTAAFPLRRCPFRGPTPTSWHPEGRMARSRCGT